MQTAKKYMTLCLAALLSTGIMAQEPLTRDQILNMTTEQLAELPLEDLMAAVETLGLSSVDELFNLIMNKNVSSASKKEEDSFKSPLSTSVITKEEMHTFGCTTFEEALRLVPGVIVREKTNGSYDVHLRGLDNVPDGHTLMYTENTNTLVMIDGRPVFNYISGATMWESLPIGIEDVERIEVVRGASGALYGANAVTGVINLITGKANETSKNVEGTFTLGSMRTNSADLVFRKAINKNLAVSISGNLLTRNRPTDKIFVIPAAMEGAKIDYFDNGQAQGRAEEFTNGKYVTLDDFKSLQTIDADGTTHSLTEPEAPIDAMFENPEQARKNMGINAGIYYNDAAKRIDIAVTGGYQQSFMQGTALMNDATPFNDRSSKTAYVDGRFNIHGGLLQLNYISGPQNLSIGTFGFKMRNQQFNGNLEYDFMPMDNLSIRPGVNYQYTRIGDSEYNNYHAYRDDVAKTASFDPKDGEEWGVALKRYSSYLNNDCDLSQLAFSLKLDYTINSLRLIGAGRVDKLKVPDKAFPSWLFSATWSINDRNVIRAVYSRANRSGILINSSSNYEWIRSELGEPDYMHFSGNKNADVMHADNIEIGYRVRPTKGVSIDFEGFYTISSDYGSLMSVNSQTTTSGSDLYTGIRNMDNFIDRQKTQGVDFSSAAKAMSNTQFKSDFTNFLRDFVSTHSYVQYQNLPYKVKQMGASLNIDWIVSNHLVAKINATVQNTKIDKYFTYQQNMAIREQTEACYDGLMNVMLDLYSHDKKYIAQTFQISDFEAWKVQNTWFTGSESDLARLADPNDEHFNPSLYYNIVYKMKETIDEKSGDMQFAIGDAQYTHDELVNGHKHKYTPSFFGSLSLIYKPVKALTFAPSAYFYGKQEVQTMYNVSRSAEKIDGKIIVNLKVAYRPTEQFEVFFNANNLFNDTRREFVYGDKIGGRYSIGVTFGF
ncbi:MAG: TonB-dependent receptor [Bacteroidales bacterium]|nr:TonB-dependent receptor [Bacteroidales bacterium]